jgi:NAD(P)-dependent dehydrogenase (short-subunit alcohol dehydrogenase family)
VRGLEQQIALVTGGATGLGRAIAQRLKAEGAYVFISDIQCDLGEETARQGGFTFISHDVCDEGAWSRAVHEIESRAGFLNILVNNAGILGPSTELTPEATSLSVWRRVFAVNVEGTFLGCRTALPSMRRAGKGSIINISSVAGLLATPYATAYGASKAAVRQLTKSIAQYCTQEGLNVRCNSVHPGNVRTALWDRQAQELATLRGVGLEEIVEEGRKEIPRGEFTLPEDVAAAVSFLASDDARHVTGDMIMVDGGIMHCDTFHMLPKPKPLPVKSE